MNYNPIYITREDNSKLRLLIAAALHSTATASLQNLRRELDRAAIIDRESIPLDVVTMESRVEFEDLETGEIEAYSITFPDHADVEAQRISILAPIGIALIGCREGQVVSWTTPGGIRRLKIRRVTPAPAEAPHEQLAFTTAR